jgi:hypothetical protein
MNKAGTIQNVCGALLRGDKLSAAQAIRERYPISTSPKKRYNVTKEQSMQVFLRDAFVDRYSGRYLVFPPVLRAISFALPKAFPYHPNWKTGECHPAFWELAATVDHVEPVTLGGSNDIGNLVTTSMQRNMAKGNFTLGEIGWTLHPPTGDKAWDGLTAWFLKHTEDHPEMLDMDPGVRAWHTVAERQY